MFFPYFKLKQLFLSLYVTCLDRHCPDPESKGTLTSYTIIKNKKYIYKISAIKTNKDTNSNLGLYINVDLCYQDLNTNNPIKPNNLIFTVEYYYNWTTNYYQKTHSYISPSIKSTWLNPLGFLNKYLITCLKTFITESIKFVDYRVAFNNDANKFEKHFKTTINRKITEPQPTKKKKTTKTSTTSKKPRKPKTTKTTKKSKPQEKSE